MTYSRPWMFSGLLMMVAGVFGLWLQGRQPVAQAEPPKNVGATSHAPGKDNQDKAAADAWRELFDGKTLTGWKTPEFGGEGRVYVKDGEIVIEAGSSMSGIAWAGEKLIRDNYELTLEGKRLDGSDFFCTTTFPVGKDACSFVVGGWGGAVVGLSSIDHADASENATMKTMGFKRNVWYPVRIRVSDAAIEAWIGGEKMVDQPRKDHAISVRIECEQCKPLGITTWCTSGAVRNVRMRALRAEEVRAIQDRYDRAAEK